MEVDDPLSTLPDDVKDAEVMKYMRELLELCENESGIWTQDDVWKVCRSIDLEYTDLNRVATLLNVPDVDAQLKNLQYYRVQLPFFLMFLRNGVNMRVCPPDVVAWAFGKLLSVKTMLSVDLKLGDLIQEQLLPIAQLLDDRMAFSLVVDLTLTLTDLMARNEQFTSDSHPTDVTVLKSVLVTWKELRHSETGTTVAIRPVPLRIVSLDSCENLQVCITCFLLHGHMSLKFITSANRQRLWMTLLKQLELGEYRLKTVTLRLALQLVAQDLCSSVMALLLVDHMLALCEWLLNQSPSEQTDVDPDFEAMEEALNSCLRECGRKLADCSKSQVFAGVTMPKLGEWGSRCVRLLEHKSAIQPRGLIDFVTGWASVMALVCSAAPDMCCPLGKSLVAFARRALIAGRPFSVGQLADLFNFFIRVDKLDSSSCITDQMIEMVHEYQQQFSSTANVSGALERYTLFFGALAQTKNASYLLPTVVPETLHLMTALRTIALLNASEGAAALTNLLLLVDTLVFSKDLTAASRKEADWLAILSVSWLANYSGSVQRYTSSLDLLVQVHNVARQMSSFCNSQVKLVTLTAIASLQIGNEWRRTLFQLALNSSDPKVVVAAVENVAIFVRSIKKVDASISLVSESILPLISLRAGDNRLRGAVLRCMSKTLCALSGQTTIAIGLAGMEIQCALCSAVSVDRPEQRLVRAAVPETFYEVLMSVLCNPTAEKEHRLEGCAVLLAMLKHADRGTPALEQRFDRLIIAALRLFVDADPDVRESFCACLPDIVKLSFSETANLDLQNIMFTLQNDNPDDSAWLARYLRIIIANANDAKLAEICFVKLVLLASVTPVTMEEAKASVLEEINKDTNCSVMGLFVRRRNVICRYLVEDLCSELKQLLTEGQRDRSSPTNFIMSRFGSLAELFDYRTAQGQPDALAWLRGASKDLVPWLVMKMSKEASAVLQCIANKMGTNRCALLLEYFSFVLLKVMQQARSEQQINALFSFVVTEGGFGRSAADTWTIEQYMVWNSHLCTVQLVLHLSENEDRFLLVLRKLHMLCEHLTIDQDAQAAESLSLSDCLRDRYLGILLNFRLAFTENEPTSEKKVVLRSLCRVIQLIDRDMVDEARLKILLVLRVAADWLPAEVAGVWLVFAQVLADASLASLLPQLLVGVWPLLNQTAIDPLLEHIFVHRLERLRLAASRAAVVDQPTNAHSDSPKVLMNAIDQLCIVASESPGSTRLDPYLPKEAQASSTETILQACLHLLREEQPEVKQFALLKLDDTLRKRPDEVHALTVGSDQQLSYTVAALIVALMDCLRSCEQLAARSLAARCLGELGAIDPGRLGLELSAPSQPGKAPVDRRPQPMTFIDDGDDFFVALLTRSAKLFVAVSDANLHELCSLCIQTMLKMFECSASVGRGRDLWQRLDASSRRNMSPLLTSNYRKLTPSVKMAHRDGPIIDSDRETTFGEWLSAWVIASAGKVEDPTLNRLFRAVDGMTDADTGFARFVLPQIILQGLLEDNAKLIEETKKEIIAVLLKTCAMDACEDSWMRMAAQVVFAILDCLYQWTLLRRARNAESLDLEKLLRVENFIKEVAMTWAHDPNILSASEMSATDPNRLLLVAAAEACQSTARALLWYEQYAVDPAQPIDQHMHAMQRLYTELDETDGVIGALAVTRKVREPTAEEYILAYEATGDYTEALPFYRTTATDQPSCDNDMGLMKCLLLLNQPQLVLSCVDEALKQRLEWYDERDTRRVMDKLNSYRIEATWRLQRWDDLDSLLGSESKSGLCLRGVRPWAN